ncbi:MULTISPECIES: glycosyltransferase [Comamonadaceae]|uniref:glycosyltransferase n=1 Tax=Comamonadaceae TaxID=80864 RepID=UPI002727C3AB|nr:MULTISPECIES: glycosyltransferase [Comamonadaceae]MDO9145891.1 glycosyltransferase [Rhodoferax sp.]MDP3887632.1 glycosyltransferase [Hydrogenophaga sp.]
MKTYDNLNLVSVVVITYQHEKYIRQCLDSILMQNINFSIEIIIGDDCSTDQTTEIIKEYQQRVPHIIKPTLRSVNVGATKNQYDCFLKCTGKYIAILDGDDFWTDNEKLKTQTNFLKNNRNYIACTQRYNVVDQDNNVIQETYSGPGRPESGDYTINDFTKYIYYGHPGTLVFRNIFLEPQYDYTIITKADRFICDITLCLILTCLGKIYVSDDVMTSYRSFQVKGGTNWSSSITKKNQMLDRIKFLKMLELYCREEFKREIRHEDRMPYYVWWSILYIIRYPSSHNWRCLKDIYSLSNDKKKVYVYIFKQVPKLPTMITNFIRKKMFINQQMRRTKT